MSRIVHLTPNRRALNAMLDYARQIPTVPVARRLNLSQLMQARSAVPQPPSWSAIFMRAYALTCLARTQLRRCWLSWPYPRLYEHPSNVCAVAVEREWQGAHEVFYGLVRHPETHTLAFIQNYLVRLQTAEVSKVAKFRSTLRFGKLPGFLQRWVLKSKLNFSGRRRVKYLGTFGLSNYGMLGAESLHPIGPQTTVLTMGPITTTGDVVIKLVYDHRILDGSYVARSLSCLDEILQTTILAELTQAQRLAA